ncbi:TPA: UDP-glucose 4-epimerase GalE [bacterium]|nr:MAG: UDP-glucose 4-epimerase GalE [Candidatus Hydrogenedentes bacterium CG1_02_42_14]HBW46330.1 UDP-glucose 4-epimerase GalE [bacterium]
MRILVTGGAGYIGSHTVRALIEHGLEPIVLDDLSRGHREFIPEGIKFFERSILDTEFITEVLVREKIEGVIHFAALSNIGEDSRIPLKYYSVNVGGSVSLLSAISAAGVKRIVVSSSAAVYGLAKKDVIHEEDECAPVSIYGETKLIMENCLRACSNQKYSWMALRYFNAAGAAEDGKIGEKHNPETHLIPLALKAVMGSGNPLTIFGTDHPTPDGTPIRDYVHVDDLAEAHVAAILSKESGVVNLGTGSGNSVKDVLDLIEEITGTKVPMLIGARRAGDPPKLVASFDRAFQILKWKPRKDIRKIILSAWNWEQS